MAAVTNYQKLGDFKNTYLLSCSVQVKNLHESHQAEIKLSTGVSSFLEALGENPFSHLFWLLEASCIPWLMAPHGSIIKAATVS